MKKTLILMAAASAFVLTGCTETDLSSDTSLAKESAPSAIQFSAKTRGAGVTRTTGGVAGNITTASLKTGDHSAGFGVVAYHTNTSAWSTVNTTAKPSFMWNQQVAWNTTNGVWSYSPVKFWPNDFSESVVDDMQGTAGQEYAAYGSQDGGKVSFFAYAPYVAFSTTSSGTTAKYEKTYVSQESTAADDGIVAITANDYAGEPQVYYILNNADLSEAVDLLWGVRGNSSGYDLANQTTDATSVGNYNTDLTKQTVSENVNFLFKHALSKIGGHTATTDPAGLTTGLQVVLDLDNGSTATGVQTGSAITGGTKQSNTLVTVKSIEIYDLKTAHELPMSFITDTESDLVKAGWFNIATGTWTETALSGSGATYSSSVNNSSTVATDGYELNAKIKEGTPTATVSGGTVTWKIDGTEEPGVVETAPTDVYTSTSAVPALVLIPSSEDQHLVVRVEYVVRTYDPNLNATAAGSEGTWTKVTQKITSKVKIPGGALKANTYYKLLLHLGLTSVKFTASVCDWEDAANAGTDGNPNNNPNNDKDVYLPSNTLDSSSDAVTETVNTATVAAGLSKTYSALATGGTVTINLTDIASGTSALGVTVTGTSASHSETYTAGETTGKVTVTLPANTQAGETQTTTVTIASTGASTPQSTVVTIVQVAP